MSCVLEKNVYSAALGWNVLHVYLLGTLDVQFKFNVFLLISFWIIYPLMKVDIVMLSIVPFTPSDLLVFVFIFMCSDVR